MEILINSKEEMNDCKAFIEQSLVAGYTVNIEFLCKDSEQLAEKYDYLIDLGDCILGY
jgi:hypothetical protein